MKKTTEKIIKKVTTIKGLNLCIFSILGSVIYFLESQGLSNLFSSILGLDHKYKTLLFINLLILLISFVSAFAIKKDLNLFQ